MKVLRALTLVFGLLFLTTQPACATINSNLSSTSIAPRGSFVKLVFEKKGIQHAVSSGVIIEHLEDNTFVLSAGHVCDPPDYESYAIDIEQNKHRLLILEVSETSDLCLLVSMNRIDKPISAIADSMLQPGDKAYNLAAPFGIYDKNMVLQFEGYYSGRVTHPGYGYELDMYTIPTRPGSSGSPIYNQNWEIVGIASMAFVDLENVGMMVTLEQIQEFLKNVWDA